MGRENFDSRVTAGRNKILRRTLTDGTLKVQLQIKAHGDDVQWPFNGQAATLSPEEQYLDRLYGTTQEVIATYDAMRSVELFLARFPFAKQGMKASAYIRFLMASYYNEGYILSERMRVFATRLHREFRKDAKGPTNLEPQINYALAEVRTLFKPIVETRGSHVHQSRYDDPELARLAMLEAISEAKPATFGPHLRRSRRWARKNALQFVKTVNDGLDSKLDRFFDFFDGLVFKKDGSIRIPTNLRG